MFGRVGTWDSRRGLRRRRGDGLAAGRLSSRAHTRTLALATSTSLCSLLLVSVLAGAVGQGNRQGTTSPGDQRPFAGTDVAPRVPALPVFSVFSAGSASGSPSPLYLATTGVPTPVAPRVTQASLLLLLLSPTPLSATASSPSALSLRIAPRFHYVRGYSVQHGWLCYGWPDGAYHCTARWRLSGGRYLSLNPGWVPSQGGALAVHVTVTVTAHVTTDVAAAPRGISQWAFTGRASYPEPAGTFQGYSWGWCTSGAALLAHDNVRGLGNALDWTRNAASRGMMTGATPQAGATVVFQPYVQGAGGGGHVGHVLAVYSSGWFLVEESNFWWNGGGFGRISFRYAHVGSGVSFIY